MDENRVAGTARSVGGKVEEGFGRVTGDTRMRTEGLVDQAAGAAQDLYGQARRATEWHVLEDADHLIAVWNERQAMRMPMLFSPTIGACPACRTTGDVDLRALIGNTARR
jgi:uncharacterized protein YjbJ (UPF0337 family)